MFARTRANTVAAVFGVVALTLALATDFHWTAFAFAVSAVLLSLPEMFHVDRLNRSQVRTMRRAVRELDTVHTPADLH